MRNELSKVPEYIARIREILVSARRSSLRSVNAAMMSAYWRVGKEIVEEEQRGRKRAGYGEEMIAELSKRLSAEFGKGFSGAHLRYCRQFYLVYRHRVPPVQVSLTYREDRQSIEMLMRSGIHHTACDEFANELGQEILPAAAEIPGMLSPRLSWSHYRLLMRISRAEARSFYEAECLRARWSVRELERQICSLLYDRLARSRDKKGLLKLGTKGHEVFSAEDLIRDPFVLEFTGLPEPPHFTETELEQALTTRLQHFLLELGRDIHFVARQKRITVDGDHFFIDLVFYHRLLKCFLLIDLKCGKLTQQDVGQMLLYTGYYLREVNQPGENPPVGLILCTEKNDAAVRYTLTDNNRKIFASKYQVHLPTVEELTSELKRERAVIEERLLVGSKKREASR